MTPKIIHYVWVGDQPKPPIVKKCIESWKKYAPEYRIICWDNDRASTIKNQYLTEALEARKWAFASDVIRLHALKSYGGIYLDSDLELTQSLDSFLSCTNFFSGFELHKGEHFPVTALMGSAQNGDFVTKLLSYYDQRKFKISENKYDTTTNTIIITKYLNELGLPTDSNPKETYHLESNVTIYPYYYFCSATKNKKNYSIHHFLGSWTDNYKIIANISFPLLKIIIVKRKRKNKIKKMIINNLRLFATLGRLDIYIGPNPQGH